jgi:hypothetical protein
LGDATSVAALLPEGARRGIYVLEFTNGERYVGQATDAASRFQAHRHGSDHHAPWTDIVAFGFREIPNGSLDAAERSMIHQQRAAGVKLRNRVGNLEHTQPSALDQFVPVVEQRHWATGGATYEAAPFAEAASRPAGPTPKLLTARLGRERLPDGRPIHEAVIDELAQLVSLAIPSAVELEGRFWTLSDYPSTAGGRFATLNVGPLELAYFPPWLEPSLLRISTWVDGVPAVCVNAVPETFMPDWLLRRHQPSHVRSIRGISVLCESVPFNYATTPVDRIVMPLGELGARRFGRSQLEGVRKLAITIMRGASAPLHARSHSRELTRRVYQRICELSG